MPVLKRTKRPFLVRNGEEITAQKGPLTKTLIKYSKNMNVTRSQHTVSSAAPAKKSVQGTTASNSTGGTATAKSKPQKSGIAQPSSEQVALRAYFIGERRRTLGIQGDETSDWVAAERELREESQTK
jgi:hypothetical protein